MIKGNYPNNDLQIIFQKYASELIYYFKQQDTKDIYQQEYIDLSLNNIKDTNAELEHDIESINNMLINSTNDSVPNLENFVKKISVNTSENHIIPQKKNINIKDPKLRVKGVKTISSKE